MAFPRTAESNICVVVTFRSGHDWARQDTAARGGRGGGRGRGRRGGAASAVRRGLPSEHDEKIAKETDHGAAEPQDGHHQGRRDNGKPIVNRLCH